MTKSTESPAGAEGLTYASAGVDNRAGEAGLKALLGWVGRTRSFRRGIGEPKLDIGYFANVIDIGHGLGLAISTDTIGSKAIIAQMMGKYDTVGIDCVAINVNDVLGVGAEPLAMVDCVSIEQTSEHLLEQIGEGLYLGAEQARISIVGGEIAQVRDMVKGYKPGLGFDLAGTCVGIVPLDQIKDGGSIRDGDALIGMRSSGIHCNGMTLARGALFDRGGYTIDQVVPGLDRPVGEELIEPTRIYVDEVMALRDDGVKVKALAHITGNGGLLNLTRGAADIGYVVEQLPEPHGIFDLIQRAGSVDDEEMFRVYNMGVGFCVVVDPVDVDRALKAVRRCGTDADQIGYAVADAKRRVRIEPYHLLGRGRRFVSEAT
jgi:phosphoribosylformylglycinamidine cyclo-ligase